MALSSIYYVALAPIALNNFEMKRLQKRNANERPQQQPAPPRVQRQHVHYNTIDSFPYFRK